MFKHLLAKSQGDGDKVNCSTQIHGHLADVYQSAKTIMSSVGASMLDSFGLSNTSQRQRLSKTLLLAAAIHDIGKANWHFQRAVHGLATLDERQPIRHEWISVWIATQPAFKEWLLPAVNGCEICWHIAMFAVAGHHPKHNRTAPADKCFGGEAITVLAEHADFHECLLQFREWFDLDAHIPQVNSIVSRGAGDRNAKDDFFRLVRSCSDFWKLEIEDSPDDLKICAIAKASLVAADVAGSALWEQIETAEQRTQWIATSLESNPSKEDLQAIVDARLNGHAPHTFQTDIAQSTASVTLVEAGCGSGKTAAAYMWAAQQQAGRRLWFCYPTTGTATEGYKGYLFDKLPVELGIRTDLFHSRRQFDIKAMLDNDNSYDAKIDAAVRVDSLKAWDTQIVTCTVDNVLMLMQNQRRGIYAWPALAGAAIVFDEVHCYDDKLFGNLLTWIQNLVGIPVLLMTASLPNGKRDAIIATANRAKRSFAHIPSGPVELESLPRYVASGSSESNTYFDALESAQQELNNGGRVLWISNTVNRTKQVREKFDAADVAVYHSRFIYKDRARRHEEVIQLFGDTEKSGIASTSQVAEMSLDLAYATLLVTELAPISALIQRFGRLNRRVDAACDFSPCSFVVIEPMNDTKFLSAPYDDAELELARQWLADLGDGPLSQLDLVNVWKRLDQSPTAQPTASTWLTGGPKTEVASIRESSYGVTVIRKCDLVAARSEGIAGYALPMNRPDMTHWQEPFAFKGYPVASDGTIDYDSKAGAEWAKFNVW